MKRVEDGKYIFETFESIHELCEVCNARPDKNGWGTVRAREKSAESWSGDITFSEAQAFLKYGYDGPVDEIKESVRKLNKIIPTQKAKMMNDVVGFAPNVPAALNLQPLTMISCEKKYIKDKIVTILYDAGNPASRTPEEIIAFGSKVAAKAVQLEHSGYRVRIDMTKVFIMDSGHRYVLRLPIKSEFNPIDIKRIAFPMTHPAMLRLIGFDWYERLPGAEHEWGYGHSLSVAGPTELREILERITSGNEYYINYGTDLEEVFAA